MAVKRYNGTSWDTVAGLGAQGAAATSSSITTWVKTASGGETSLTGNSDSSTTLAYTPGQEQVFINGVLQVRGSDYTATNGTSITGLSALTAGDIATVTTVNAFSVTGAVPLSTVTANGDLIVGTSAGAVGRLGVGSSGQVLSVSGGTPTWATPVANMSWSSILTRTNMGSGTSYTASGLSGYNQLMVFIDGIGNTGTTGKYTITFNGDTSANYFFSGGGYSTGFPTTDGSGQRFFQASATTSIDFAEVAQTTNLDGAGAIHILGANTTAIKTGLLQSGMEYTANTTPLKYTRHLNFRYLGTSVISSVTVTATAGNLNNSGFITIIGSVN
jgi:hypothetical protein